MATQRGAGREQEDIIPKVGKNYLLLIGIDAYQHWQPLSNAVKDAREFQDVLLRQYQFEQANVFTLFNDAATESNIYTALRDMKARLQPQDSLIVYYSGHGHYDTDFDEGYWIPVNAKPSDESSYISNANIVKRINALETQHTLLIVDSCFSGSLVVQKRNAIPDERFRSRRILASGRHETVSDGREGENSPFAAGVLTYLRRNTSPKLDTTSLIKYVKDYVFGKAKQHPVDGRIQNSADEGGEFVFHLKRDEEAVWQEVSRTHTVAEYRNYLAGFPDGKYVALANRKINELDEDNIWQQAKINDNELSFDDYISRFTPGGKYLTEAQDRLRKLRAEREVRQRAQAEKADRDNQRAQLQKQYADAINTAESLYKERKLEAAREQYRVALGMYLPGFAPNQQYIEEQLNFCQNNIAFLGHYENGKAAMQQGNFRLAIEYYQEALKVNNNAKVEALIVHCRQQMQQQGKAGQQGKTQQRTVVNQQKAPAKSRPIWWMLAGAAGLFVLFVVYSIIVYGTPEEPTDSAYSLVDDGTPPNDDGQTYAPPATAELLLGPWEVSGVYILQDGNAYDATQESDVFKLWIGSVYDFYDNGTVAFTLAGVGSNLYYTLEGNNLFVQAEGYGQGVIDYIDENELVFTLPYTSWMGSYNIQFRTVRVGG